MKDIGIIKTSLDGKGVYESGTWTPVLYGSSGSSNTINTTTNLLYIIEMED